MDDRERREKEYFESRRQFYSDTSDLNMNAYEEYIKSKKAIEYLENQSKTKVKHRRKLDIANNIKKPKVIIIGCISIVILYLLWNRFVYTGERVIIKPDNKTIHRVECPLVKKASGDKIIIVKDSYGFYQCKTCHPINIIDRLLGKE